MKENRIIKLKRFLQENFPKIQAFNSRNIVGNIMDTVYEEDGIIVDYCFNWEYIEIFGLDNEEFEELLDEKSFLGSRLKDFSKELSKCED